MYALLGAVREFYRWEKWYTPVTVLCTGFDDTVDFARTVLVGTAPDQVTVAQILPRYGPNEGCILLGLFWPFLFRFRNQRIYGISISKTTLLLKTEYPWRR